MKLASNCRIQAITQAERATQAMPADAAWKLTWMIYHKTLGGWQQKVRYANHASSRRWCAEHLLPMPVSLIPTRPLPIQSTTQSPATSSSTRFDVRQRAAGEQHE
jgi:hypothetical protein